MIFFCGYFVNRCAKKQVRRAGQIIRGSFTYIAAAKRWETLRGRTAFPGAAVHSPSWLW